jgi:hypothetical protein
LENHRARVREGERDALVLRKSHLILSLGSDWV